MHRLYDDNMYRFNDPEPSYWEATAGPDAPACDALQSNESCDVAIIGGGYTGLSAAYHLTRDYQLDVRVCEAGHIGWGASGRNGGFCSIGGSALGLGQQLATYGVDHVRHYYQSQVEAVQLVASIIQDEQIDTPRQGDAALEVAHSQKAFEELSGHAARQSELLGLDTCAYSADEFRERFFDSTEQYGATRIRPTFGLHPMRYVRGLARAAVRTGARLHPRSEIVEWTKDGVTHQLLTKGGSLRAKQVIVACNGFTPEHLHKELLGVPLPMISAIIVTRPLTDAELAAHSWTTDDPSINSRELMNYFRMLPDHRFMFGGRGHSSGVPEGTEEVLKQLRIQLLRQWPEWRDVGIDYGWHGLICMTRRMTPCIGQLETDRSVYFGFGYHGNGVNTSTWTGKQIADWLGSGGSATPPDTLPVMVRGLSPAFPFASLRLFYLRLALLWKRWQDRYGL